MIEELFFELTRVAVGNAESLSRLPSAREWGELYKMAAKQSLVGVCFAALQRLGADADEGFARIGMSEMLYLTWMGMAAKIQQKNQTVDEQCVALQKRLSADGLRSCIMKGQANALLYSLPINDFSSLSLLRQSGDIDVWVEGGREKVVAYVQKTAPTNDIRDNHAALNLYTDTEVEAHFRPAILRNPIRNKKLQRFFADSSEKCYTNKMKLMGNTIYVPTTEFNLVYQMVHIFDHFFTEGVGLRQLMDYYFVLNSAQDTNEISRAKEVVHGLGLDRFASALMWVIAHVFACKDVNYPWKPNEKDGRFLLNEIMISGNFGKQDESQKKMYDNRWNSFWTVHVKTLRFWRFDHSAWFWSPLWRVFGFAVRKVNGYN